MQSNEKKSNQPKPRKNISCPKRAAIPLPKNTELYFTNAPVDLYKRKIACLISLLMQIKALASTDLLEALEIDQLESLLDKPEISDKDWRQENHYNQLKFLCFLNFNILFHKRILKILEKKENQHTS